MKTEECSNSSDVVRVEDASSPSSASSDDDSRSNPAPLPESSRDYGDDHGTDDDQQPGSSSRQGRGEEDDEEGEAEEEGEEPMIVQEFPMPFYVTQKHSGLPIALSKTDCSPIEGYAWFLGECVPVGFKIENEDIVRQLQADTGELDPDFDYVYDSEGNPTIGIALLDLAEDEPQFPRPHYLLADGMFYPLAYTADGKPQEGYLRHPDTPEVLVPVGLQVEDEQTGQPIPGLVIALTGEKVHGVPVHPTAGWSTHYMIPADDEPREEAAEDVEAAEECSGEAAVVISAATDQAVYARESIDSRPINIATTQMVGTTPTQETPQTEKDRFVQYSEFPEAVVVSPSAPTSISATSPTASYNTPTSIPTRRMAELHYQPSPAAELQQQQQQMISAPVAYVRGQVPATTQVPTIAPSYGQALYSTVELPQPPTYTVETTASFPPEVTSGSSPVTNLVSQPQQSMQPATYTVEAPGTFSVGLPSGSSPIPNNLSRLPPYALQMPHYLPSSIPINQPLPPQSYRIQQATPTMEVRAAPRSARITSYGGPPPPPPTVPTNTSVGSVVFEGIRPTPNTQSMFPTSTVRPATASTLAPPSSKFGYGVPSVSSTLTSLPTVKLQAPPPPAPPAIRSSLIRYPPPAQRQFSQSPVQTERTTISLEKQAPSVVRTATTSPQVIRRPIIETAPWSSGSPSRPDGIRVVGRGVMESRESPAASVSLRPSAIQLPPLSPPPPPARTVSLYSIGSNKPTTPAATYHAAAQRFEAATPSTAHSRTAWSTPPAPQMPVHITQTMPMPPPTIGVSSSPATSQGWWIRPGQAPGTVPMISGHTTRPAPLPFQPAVSTTTATHYGPPATTAIGASDFNRATLPASVLLSPGTVHVRATSNQPTEQLIGVKRRPSSKRDTTSLPGGLRGRNAQGTQWKWFRFCMCPGTGQPRTPTSRRLASSSSSSSPIIEASESSSQGTYWTAEQDNVPVASHRRPRGGKTSERRKRVAGVC